MINELLRKTAESCPEAPALLAPNREAMKYGRLWDHVQGVAWFLHSIGIGTRDRVAVVLPEGPEMASSFLAISAAAACAPLNPNYRASEFEFYLSDLKPKALIVQSAPSGQASADSTAAVIARSRGIRVIELVAQMNSEAGIFTLDGIGLTGVGHPITRQPDEEALVLHTSGTTSRPKMVPLTQANLCSSAQNIATSLLLAPEDQCLNVMPMFHIHGLVGALLSSIAVGSRVVCTPGFHSVLFFNWLEEFRPTWYTAVPTMHQAILDRASQNPGIHSHSSLRFIRSCSSALPPKVMANLEKEFQVPVVEAYGMTEASHQVSINPLPPGLRKPGAVGLPTGCQMAVFGETGALLPAGEIGVVAIRGSNITHGYCNNPEANESAFRDGWFRTGDLGKLDADGYLYLTGRTNEIINRGGEKISPREIDEVLLDHPAVAQAMTFAIPDEKLAEDIGAAVVLRGGVARNENSEFEMELREFVAARIAHFKVPRQIVFVDEIPQGTTGKPQRMGMAARLGLAPAAVPSVQTSRSFTPARTETETRLVEIWGEVLGIERVRIRDDFFKVGGDSISALRLCSRIRTEFGVDISFLRLFQDPTLESLAAWMDSAGAESIVSQPPQIPHVATTGEIPLSYSQQQFWFLDRFEDGGANFIRLNAYRLRGALDVGALHDSLNRIVARHAILRATYQERDGLPVQVVHDARTLELPSVDLSLLPEAERLRRADELARQEAWRPFNLSSDLMVRATLLRLAKDEHILLLTNHHIASDGWSARLILRELAELYRAKCEQRLPMLPDLTIQYADFALFQRQCFERGLFDAQIEYWKERLTGAPALLNLPTDRPRPERQTYRGGVESRVLPKALPTALKRMDYEQRVTLHMTLLAAFQVLLHRYSDETDLVVGSPIAGRKNGQTESLVGLFSNILALRADLGGDPTFREFLARTRETALEAHTNQDVPTERVIEHLRINRSARHPALFQVLFQLRNLGAESVNLGPLTLEPFDFDPGTGQFDLSLDIRERSHGLYCALNYNSDLYDSETAKRILSHYQALLESIAGNIDARISTLNILPEQERQKILINWNQTQTDFSRESRLHESIHELIESQARSMPDAIAVVYRNEKLTYQELDRRANGWAHRLRELGVNRGVLVGISLQRSSSLAVALLGVLKAGGTYLPLDPKYPRQRVAEILEDARCKLVITTSKEAQNLPAEADLVYMDQDRPSVAAIDDPPVGEVQPHDSSYVIFTSGSTGKANGVLIEHQSLVNCSHFFMEYMELRPGDRVLQFNSLSFDTAAEEIFPCWLAGATLVFWPESYAPSITEFLEFAEREQITLLDLPTAYWHEWASEIAAVDLPFPSKLRAVVIGGEKALAPKLAAWKKTVGSRVRLCNTYGPTEATITSTAYDVAQSHVVGDTVPIGRPISNATLYILDRHLQPTPIGIPGELYIGGSGVAPGYLNRPELTAKKFLANPFRDTPDARLYKTGDRVRYLADGTVEFLGRIDDQVKWRGFRIELGELENVLARHPDVRAAAASLREQDAEQFGLVAYVVRHPGTVVQAEELRSFLKERLPEYMLPPHYMFLEKLPLTTTGKVDRRALPKPDGARLSTAKVSIPPRTELESEIAAIWEDVLGIKGIGIHDNFFDLGGHSLKVVQMLSRVRAALHVEVPFRRVFEGPTVAEMGIAVLEIFGGSLEASEMSRILAEID